jgi:hypothetical protein
MTGTLGGSDRTVYLDNQPTYASIVDGNYHVVVCTWGGGDIAPTIRTLPPSVGNAGANRAPAPAPTAGLVPARWLPAANPV